MEIIAKAFKVAYEHHKGQTRKVTKHPFIVHPIEVAQILFSLHASSDVIAAGLLHDTIEDTSYSVEQLRNDFGEPITSLVIFASEEEKIQEQLTQEEEKQSWKARKLKTIEKSQYASREEILVEFADKLSNLRSLFRESLHYKEEMWQFFNASKEEIAWYYQSLYEIFVKKLQDDPFAMIALQEYHHYLTVLFS